MDSRSEAGSSPLTRGKPTKCQPIEVVRRLIPAHAGKTHGCPASSGKPTAHPRSRGENVTTVTKARAVEGSSPLTRGKPRLFLRTHLVGRLIPAHAGKTQSPHWCAGLTKAHPRSRGENVQSSDSPSRALGSSPLTRGKPRSPRYSTATARLIPAHAGKTQPPGLLPAARPAHPRSRGENGPAGRPVPATRGSSPLTRGKRRQMHLVHVIRGLIPAHAGKTRPPWPGGHGSPAHPRSRGENASSSMPIKSAYGSSPLTRGKHVATPSWAARPRLIPAHAGKTNTLITTMFYNKAHPRSRGENTALVSQRFQFGNSSPLTRGKHSVHSRLACGSRLIPAHAGKTSPQGL